MKEKNNYVPEEARKIKEEIYLAQKNAYENHKIEMKNSEMYLNIKRKSKELISAKQTGQKSESF